MSGPGTARLRAHLGMLLWAAFVGLSFPAVGLLSEGLPPLLLTAMRFTVAAVALMPLAWRQSDAWPAAGTLALYGAMGLCLAGFFGTMFWAAHRVSALSMATLFVSVPLLAYCLGRDWASNSARAGCSPFSRSGRAGRWGWPGPRMAATSPGCSWASANWVSSSAA